MNTPKTYEMIEAAVDLIKATGWTQHALSRDSAGLLELYGTKEKYVPVCYCAMGAVEAILDEYYAEATSSYEDIEKTYQKAMAALHAATHSRSLASFNDAEGRTKEEVLELMLSTAGQLRMQATMRYSVIS